MGRLSGVGGLGLRLPKLCAEFYVLEMAVNHIPDGPAAAIFERYLRETAPKIALTLEYSISTELPYAKSVKAFKNKKAYEGDDCPMCEGEYYLEECGDYGGCGTKHVFVFCPGCEIHFINGETIGPATASKYPESTRFFKQCNNEYDHISAYNRTYERYGPEFLGDNSKAFHKGIWTPGYGGKMWGTIADVVRDYWDGTIKPRTFLDRAWTLQHNNASVFDKIYSISELMQVLKIQAKGDYTKLSEWTEPYVANTLRRMERWTEVYAVNMSTHRGIRPGTGTGD